MRRAPAGIAFALSRPASHPAPSAPAAPPDGEAPVERLLARFIAESDLEARYEALASTKQGKQASPVRTLTPPRPVGAGR